MVPWTNSPVVKQTGKPTFWKSMERHRLSVFRAETEVGRNLRLPLTSRPGKEPLKPFSHSHILTFSQFLTKFSYWLNHWYSHV
jgi:hypothetical protein